MQFPFPLSNCVLNIFLNMTARLNSKIVQLFIVRPTPCYLYTRNGNIAKLQSFWLCSFLDQVYSRFVWFLRVCGGEAKGANIPHFLDSCTWLVALLALPFKKKKKNKDTSEFLQQGLLFTCSKCFQLKCCIVSLFSKHVYKRFIGAFASRKKI